MNRKVFIDSDVILDLLCKREPHYDFAAGIFTLADTKKLNLMTTAMVFANVFYILRKSVGNIKAKEYLRKLRILVQIAASDEKIVDLALNSNFSDFEDGLQYFTALKNGIGILLTRNKKDFKVKDVLIQTPEEFVKTVK